MSLVQLTLINGTPVYLNPDQIVSAVALPTQSPTTTIATVIDTWTVQGAVDEVAAQLGAQLVLTVAKVDPPTKVRFDTFENPADFEAKLKERRDAP